MDAGVVLAVVLALAFAFTTGVQDAANSIATLIATRAGRPGPALVMATAAMLVGPFLVGSAVADTVAGIVDVEPVETVEVVTAALAAALVWNTAAWYAGIPSSSTHALIGGLVGAAIAAAGLDAVNWGGLEGLRPVGVVGILVVLATSPLVGALAAVLVLLVFRRILRRGTRRFSGPVRDAQWVTSALLSVGQGANDAQARRSFEDGVSLEKKGDYAGALAKFRESMEIKATLGNRFHIAYCLEMTGKLAAALEESLRTAGSSGGRRRARSASPKKSRTSGTTRRTSRTRSARHVRS